MIKGWDIGFASMTVGEKAVLTCAPAYAYGEMGSPPKIPANATLNFEVELLGFEAKKKEKYEMTTEERFSEYENLKAKATLLFKENNFVDAAAGYEEATSYLEDMYEAQTEEQNKADELQRIANLNIALCKMKLQDWTGTIVAVRTKSYRMTKS